MDQIITKKLDDKSVVWLENSNQYFVLEDKAAQVVGRIHRKENVNDVAHDLSTQLNVPYQNAMNLVNAINKNILSNGVKKFSGDSNQILCDETFEVRSTQYYSINSKIFKVDFSDENLVGLIHPKFSHLMIDKLEMIDVSFSIYRIKDYIHMEVDGVPIGSWRTNEIHYFQGKFAMKIVESIYEKSEQEWMGVFHASALSLNDQGVLILGDSGNGKSTSLGLLQAHGFSCVADDFVPVDDQAKIFSFPAAISIKTKSIPVLSSYYPQLLETENFYDHRLGKVMRYLPPMDLNYDKTYPCKALVFIKYDPDIDFICQQVNHSTAIEELIPDSWISGIPKNVHSFLNWFSNVPCYCLIYSDNKKMIQQVKKIVNHGL